MYPADIRGSFSVYFRIVSVLFGGAFVASLSDAEVGEDGGEEVGGGDGAGDEAEVEKGFADVLGHEVGGDAGLKAGNDTLQRRGTGGQSFVMTGVRHYQFVCRVVLGRGHAH